MEQNPSLTKGGALQKRSLPLRATPMRGSLEMQEHQEYQIYLALSFRC